MSLIGFESPFPVAVSQTGDTEWELTAAMTYHGRYQTFTVPVGQTTDFASVPAVLTWLVPIETGIPAAVLHDYLWRVKVPASELEYREADGILRQALGSLGVPGPRRWLMWAAVRWGSLTRPGGHQGWLRDAPAVVAVTLLGLPLALPAVLLLPSTGVLTLADWIFGRSKRGA
jgi:hypothetical protein